MHTERKERKKEERRRQNQNRHLPNLLIGINLSTRHGESLFIRIFISLMFVFGMVCLGEETCWYSVGARCASAVALLNYDVNTRISYPIG